VLEPLRIYQLLRQEWGAQDKPGSSSSSSSVGSGSSDDGVVIKASSFDAFVDAALDALPTLNLTVVTGEDQAGAKYAVLHCLYSVWARLLHMC
jgi:hypothetical protein